MIFDKELIDKVSSKTLGDYKPYNTQREGKVLIDTEGVVYMIEDLLTTLESAEEELYDMKTYYENYYEFVPEKEAPEEYYRN